MATQVQIDAVIDLHESDNRADIVAEYSTVEPYDIASGGSYRDAENGNVKVGGDPYELAHAKNA